MLLSAVCCRKDISRDYCPELVETELSAVWGAEADTRLSLSPNGSGFKTEWTSGDKIGVFDNIDPGTIRTFYCIGGGKQAKFIGTASAGATEFYAVYPFDANAFIDWAGGKIISSLPSSQVAVKGSIPKEGFVAVAHCDNDLLEFRNAFGLVSFTLDGSGAVDMVTLEGNNGERLSGVATLKADGSNTCSGTSVSLTAPGGKTFEAGTYYMALSPVNFTKGFTVTVHSKVYSSSVKTTAKSASIPRSGGLALGNITAGAVWERPSAPEKADNNICAHRAGYHEVSGVPANSIAAIEYCVRQGFAGAEVDILLTADERIIVCHPDSDGKVNGLLPKNSTLAQIRAAGTLSNGEPVPVLEDAIDAVMVSGSCTKLQLDIKAVDGTWDLRAGKLAADMAVSKGATAFVDLMSTSLYGVYENLWPYVEKLGIPLALNNGTKSRVSGCSKWLSACAPTQMFSGAGGKGSINPDNFTADYKISVFTIDRDWYNANSLYYENTVSHASDNSVYSPAGVQYYVQNWSKFHLLMSNEPSWLRKMIFNK